MNIKQLMAALAPLPSGMEVRVGDVSEGHDLHCSVGEVVRRGESVVLVPGDDGVWQDETLSSEILMEQLWPEEGEEND